MIQDRFRWLLPKSDVTEEATKIHRKIQQTARSISSYWGVYLRGIGLSKSGYRWEHPDRYERCHGESSQPRGVNPVKSGSERRWRRFLSQIVGSHWRSAREHHGYLVQDGNELSEFEAWCKVLTYHEAPAEEGKKFTIRFIGTCQLPARPIVRFLADLSSGTSGHLTPIMPENKDVTIFQNLETNYYHRAFQVSGLFPTIRLEALERQFDVLL
ncbi:uncharacterized protein PG986_006138 [Apiospora aurea]|uniref:Uncharacterized protein n=1 Tax=Apiospora aurea TaxID=335848 RepID=A0ABR1QJJ9_9PEZI